jgi:hypothetical protein
MLQYMLEVVIARCIPREDTDDLKTSQRISTRLATLPLDKEAP